MKKGSFYTSPFGCMSDSVRVRIFGANHVMIGQGACTFNILSGNYEFTATVEVPDMTGVTIIVKATDIPGHSDQKTVTLSLGNFLIFCVLKRACSEAALLFIFGQVMYHSP